MRPAVRSFCPILPVSDVQATLDWYKSSLGAANDWTYGDPPGHAGCTLGSSGLQFSLEPDRVSAVAGFELYVFVVGVSALHDEYLSRGVQIADELERKPWGANEFAVIDPNGVRLRFAEFGQPSSKGPRIEGLATAWRHLTPAEHASLYEAVGWTGYYTRELTAETLSKAPLATVTVEHGGKLIGAASIIGNGVDAFIVRDVMVLPEFQGRGVGRHMMRELVKWTEDNVPKGAHVLLQTGGTATEFYEQFGFIGPDKGLVGMYLPR